MKARRILAYFPTFARGYLRNPLGLFMSLIFPVVLILIFGAVFSNTGVSRVPLTVQDLDGQSPACVQFLAALNATGVVSVAVVGPEVGNLSNYLSHNSLSSGLVLPAGFAQNVSALQPVRLLVYTNPTSSDGGIVLGAVTGVVNGLNLHLAGGSEVVSTVPLHVGGTTYGAVDYFVPGLIGFSILVGPMFSMVNISSTWKRDKLFRQLSLTPLTRGEWLAATLLWYVVLAGASTLLLFGAALAVFGAHVSLTLFVVPFLVLGPVLFVGLGLLAGSVSGTPESAAVIGNIITFPMMFLSGTFFPVSVFPDWLKTVATFLPLYYVIDGLNAGMIFDNPSAVLTDTLIVGVLALAVALASVTAFRWRGE